MTSDHLVELLQTLDAPQWRYKHLDNYFQGISPLSFLSKEAKVALRNFDQLSSNLCRTAVVSLQERLRLSGVSGTDAWSEFEYSDLDQLAAQVHRDALLYGVGYVLCWTDARGNARATVESPKQVAIQRDPVTREIVAAVKRVRTKTTTEAWLYLSDEVQHWRANTPGAATAGFYLIDTVPHSLGVVPVVAIGFEDEPSVIADLLSIQDAINKLITDMLIASEYAGRPRRFASGIELVEKPVIDEETGEPALDEEGQPIVEAQNPFPETNRMMTSEDPASRFGALPAADLKTFESGVRVLISQAMMVSGLPAHYVGLLQDSVTSAEALKAAEAALVARAEARQRAYGVGWEAVARLLVAIRDNVDPSEVTARIQWAPADTRSTAQEADAAVKLFQSGILSRTGVLKRLGLSEDEIAAELEYVKADAKLGHDIKFGAFVSDLNTGSGRPESAAA